MKYVTCPVTITSPAPNPDLGFEPNVPCGLTCEVHREAPVMEFRCTRGHAFLATSADVEESAQ